MAWQRGGRFRNRGNRGRDSGRGHRGRGNYRGFRGNRDGHRGNFHDRRDFKPVDRKNNVNFSLENLTEGDIGITEYVSSLQGFTGVLKSRYSDFHVNEIDQDGNLAKLTDLSIPVDKVEDPKEEDDEELVRRYQLEKLPIETWDEIHKMVQSEDKETVVKIDVTAMSKDDRTKIHEAVKTVYGQKVIGSTITEDEKKYIKFTKYNKLGRIDRREKWPESRGGEFVYFLVHKEHVDTIEANIQISECLSMRPSSFCYAGVKDRRAKTTQWFCVRKVNPSRIVEKIKRLKNIHVGNFCYKNDTLRLGQLKGNRFRIALRNITIEDEIINKALESLRDHGFINYYGLQRFGNYKEAPTHQIGLQLMKSNWKEACQLILKPRKWEMDRDIAIAKSVYSETGDANLAHGKLERKRDRCVEGRLLAGLAKHNQNDYVNALENIPRNMRLLYVHAYQSLIWNKVVSIRIKDFGLKPIVGDLIIEGDISDTSDLNPDVEDSLSETISEEKEDSTDNNKKTGPNIKILTENDLDNYSIYDVVLPLPGYDIKYPDNVIRDHYKKLLTDDGLSLEMPKQKVKTYTLSGAYRKIVEKVSNLSWKIMGYNDKCSNLIRSDYEELMKIPEPEHIKDAEHKALILDMCLSSSCYATMALREIMKMDTSTQTHINLSNKLNQVSETSTSNTDENTKECVKSDKTDDVCVEKRKLESVEDNSKKMKLDD